MLDYYGEKKHLTTSFNGNSYSYETWERRRYNYTNSNNINRSPVTNFFMMLLKYVPDIISKKK